MSASKKAERIPRAASGGVAFGEKDAPAEAILPAKSVHNRAKCSCPSVKRQA
ncbi:MAG: hypothetical protein H7A53_13005 [Akkermansiaceae bacterium]|nr:hypothetical protein [Akkermansiaceae bacterium]